MNKAEIVEKMAKEASITKSAANAALDSFIDSVTRTLKKKDGKVTLVGFGTFQQNTRKSRRMCMRGPLTGRGDGPGGVLKIKARNIVFRPGKKLRDAI